eukprot:CAMPEP_0174843888 /NCGR_PEP_ID=MMETSP1114-20130205/10799_1 /TAXON_ID=312471 /ORGANISM="Neobodo designis, Strain CCAP 1951/1" /LENGTH=226 /DNA_ID=CAMNT_0016078119 /DNA_START=35 /DNA_END=712 /DNA_ORIENTATION=-
MEARSLIQLRQRLRAAREERLALKRLLQSSEFLLESHHSAYALDNVTLDRKVEDLKDAAALSRKRIEALERDVATAKEEHERLSDENATLLAIVQSKEKAQAELRDRHQRLAVAERRCGHFCETLAQRKNDRARHTAALQSEHSRLVQGMGANHNAVLRDEQRLLDEKLDLDVARRKEHLPGRRGELPVSYEAYLSTCTEPACMQNRQLLNALQAELASLEQRATP